MPKVIVYHNKRYGAGLGLPDTPEVRSARRKVEAGTHLPFQRVNRDGTTDYLLVRKTPIVERLLRAVNFGVFR